MFIISLVCYFTRLSKITTLLGVLEAFCVKLILKTHISVITHNQNRKIHNVNKIWVHTIILRNSFNSTA